MIIKKFQAETESEAIMKAKEEMGSAAVVVNIKTIRHRGISRLFKKGSVEVTAALEEVPNTASLPVKSINVAINDAYKAGSSFHMVNDEQKASAIEEKLNNLQNILETRMRTSEDDEKSVEADKEEKHDEESTNENSVAIKFMKLIYNQLLDNEVDEVYANQIIGEIQVSTKKEASVDSILAAIYQKIVLKIGQPKTIEMENNKHNLIFFVGPTGVGKTTTIAKLASYFKLEKKAKVALVTSDTFRIAAVEQLRTYAGILDVPLRVIYTIEELNQAVNDFKNYDIIMVDTAGRSHKNNEQCNEVFHLVNDIKIADDVEKQVYLVLSAATKYKDLIRINDVFNKLENYNLLFTKLDETTSLGNILNMKLKTGVPLSYVTSGQVVPDDIGVLDPQKIARSLLGSNE